MAQDKRGVKSQRLCRENTLRRKPTNLSSLLPHRLFLSPVAAATANPTQLKRRAKPALRLLVHSPVKRVDE